MTLTLDEALAYLLLVSTISFILGGYFFYKMTKVAKEPQPLVDNDLVVVLKAHNFDLYNLLSKAIIERIELTDKLNHHLSYLLEQTTKRDNCA